MDGENSRVLGILGTLVSRTLVIYTTGYVD